MFGPLQVCEGDRDEDEDEHTHQHCEFAGDFFILGGANEMPWSFNLPYYFDITDAVKHLEVPLDGHYHVVAEVFSVNGTSLGTNVLSRPYGSYRSPPGHTDRKCGKRMGRMNDGLKGRSKHTEGSKERYF